MESSTWFGGLAGRDQKEGLDTPCRYRVLLTPDTVALDIKIMDLSRVGLLTFLEHWGGSVNKRMKQKWEDY